MPATYTLITSSTLTTSAASVTFSNIPGTYTDLVLRLSARSNPASDYTTFKLVYNSDTSALYSETRLYAEATNSIYASTQGGRNNNTARYTKGSAGTSTSDTFSNFELYIPSYTTSRNKSMSQFGVAENNTTDAGVSVYATLYRSTSAITAIEIGNFSTDTFNSGSSFWLYGIKNS